IKSISNVVSHYSFYILGEEIVVHKDYEVSIVEEQPTEEEQSQPQQEERPLQVRIIEEVPEVEESHPIEVIEEEQPEEEDVPTVGEGEKPKKKKKIVKKKLDEHDVIIQKLLEQEIEKTELEKYEKFEFERPEKVKPEFANIEPQKIERKEQKPTKLVVVETTEEPQSIKLKPAKRKPKAVEEQAVQLPKFKLKSRMELVEYPPEAELPQITEIGAVRESGELTRNIEEAEELLKFKPQKVKKLKKIKGDLEKPQLEKYEKYVSSEEEIEETAPYQKPEKTPKAEDKPEEVKLKIGKGKKKPIAEEQPESVTLKKTPLKPKEAEVVEESVPKKKEEVPVKVIEETPEQPTYELQPFEPTEFEQPAYEKEELEPVEMPEEPKKEKKEPKQKPKPKSKPKPEPEVNITQIVPGVPKEQEEVPEDEVKFRIPESEVPEESKEEVKLKPIKKVKEAPAPVEEAKIVPQEEDTEKIPIPDAEEQAEKKKKPKAKKAPQKEAESVEEIPEEQFEISVTEEQPTVPEQTVEEKAAEVKLKKKKPKEAPLAEVQVVEDVPKEEIIEEAPVEYKITTTVIEPEEAPEEHKVRVIDYDQKEVTVEEVVEERVVTRKKKPKPQKPEEYEYSITEPQISEVPSEVIETIPAQDEQPEEVAPDEAVVDVKETGAAPEEPVAKVSIKKKKPIKKLEEEVEVEEVPLVEEVKEHVSEKEVIEDTETKEVLKKVKPKSYKFKLTETEAEKAPEQLAEEIPEEEEKPQPVVEEIAEDFPTYEITTTDIEAEVTKQIEEIQEVVKEKKPKKVKTSEAPKEYEIGVVEEVVPKPVEEVEQPDGAVFSIKKKPKKEVPEEFEAAVVLTELKPVEEVETEVAVKKKPKKPKTQEDVSVIHEIKVVETETPKEEIEEQTTQEVVVTKKAPSIEEVPAEYKFGIVESQVEERVPSVEFTVKEEETVEQPVEEPEAQFVIEESKPTEEVVEEAKIKTKKSKKKPTETQEVELKVKVTEEVPEKPTQVEEEIDEIITEPEKVVPEEKPKEYVIGIKESMPEKTEPLVFEEPEIPKEKELVEEAPVQEVKVITTTPKEEIIEEVSVVKKKVKKPKETKEELKVDVVEETPKAEEEKPHQVILSAPTEIEEKVEEKPKEYEVQIKETVIEKQPEETAQEEIALPKKKKPVPQVTEEPEAEVRLTTTKPVEEVQEEVKIKKKPKKKPEEGEAAAELKVTVVEELPATPIVEEIIVEEEQEVRPVPQKIKEEAPKEYEIKVKESEIEKPKEEILEEQVSLPSKKKPVPQVTEEPEEEVKLTPKKPTEEVQEEIKIKKKSKKEPKVEEAEAALKVTVVEETPAAPEVVEEIEEVEEIVPKQIEEKPKEYYFKVTESETEKPKEELPEEQVTLPKKKKPIPQVTEEPEAEVTLKTKKPTEEVQEEVKIKKKAKKVPKPEEAAAELKVTIEEEVPQEPQIEEVEEIEEVVVTKQEQPEEKPKEYEFKLKETEPQPQQIIEEEVSLPQKKPIKPETKEEPEAEVTLKPKKDVEEVKEELKVVKKKQKKPKEEAATELTVQVEEEVVPEPIVEEVEEIEEVIVPKKPKEIDETEEVKVKLVKPAPEEAPEDVQIDVVLKPKKPKEVETEEFAVDVKLPKQKVTTQETTDETVALKKKKKPKPAVEEAADELKLTKEVVEERPIEIEEEEIVEEAIVMRRKPKKAFEPTVEEHEEQEFSLSLKKPLQINKDVAEEATVLKKRPSRPMAFDEAGAELSLKREEEYEEGEDVEEFVVERGPKPKALQVTEEQDQEYTVKKLKRRKKGVEIPEFTDVENVTFRPKTIKTKEDVDQEFNIALDSYAEEEISMSGKVKLKKPITKTYSEAADEAKVKIFQDYEDDDGPIIEEIRDDSSIEDTMYDVEEPEEYQVEELPPDDFAFTIKPKKPAKPRYSIQDEEEEQFLIGLRRPKSDSVTYDEDSFTFKKKRKVIQQIFNEEGASLNITREMNIEETDDENAMYSICNYIADNDEAINLVEGEKVYVIGRHSSEWWYVKKNITEEEGWVPAQYLMEPTEYTHYVQKKLHEKIDKLPVFERPGPEEKPMAPRFIEKLQPIHTPDGYTVQFECKVEGIPRPQIAWFRETAIIKPSQDFQMYYDDDNVATLIIREVFPEDAGKFTCVAKNAAGFTSTTTELIVETPLSDHGSDATGLSRRSMSRESSLADILEGIPPTFSRKPKAQYVDENTNVILECRLVAVPEPDIVWTFNGEEIDVKETKNIRIVTESDMHMYCSVVHITKVKKSQEGTYEVIATNREGESRLPIVLKVRTDEKEPPQILEPLRNTVVREGESVVLTTQIVGNPRPKVTWYKDGKPITKNTKSDKDTHTLTLISPKTAEGGEYTVKAENPLGSVETTANLTIEEPSSGNAEPPLFVERFEEQSVPQKGTIRLPAKVTGQPVPEVQWLFNNNPLYPSERIQQVYDGENIELIIKDANPDTDSGDYKCIASNPIGKTSHGARVIVEVDEVTFTKKLKKTITIEEIQSLTLECETSHVVTTKWFFNGKELSGMDHRVVVEDGKVHKLVIRNTNLRDSGTYVCKVKNIETESTVEVLPRKPEFIKILEDYEVTEKETAILDVEVSTDTAEVVWYKDGEKITPEKKNVELVKEGKVRKLIIHDSTIHDEGEYTCKLEEQECTAELTVIELPPEIIKPLENVTVTKGENAVFEIELSKGDALVKWFKDGKELPLNEHVQLTIDGKKQ
ncbi:PREDICTED: titin-like, partial [Rhagoletis zephyria]|uniref:titin-like n=1 Tax=Rhagoletis zephyria TaxID=28612 RepID=UPI000811855F